MTRENMLRRLRKGDDPLEISIKKWKDIEEGKGKDDGRENCALCETCWDISARDCEGCAVSKHTGREGCHGTPYYYYDPKDFTAPERARAFRLFLEGLRK